jgi:hypothetical protein
MSQVGATAAVTEAEPPGKPPQEARSGPRVPARRVAVLIGCALVLTGILIEGCQQGTGTGPVPHAPVTYVAIPKLTEVGHNLVVNPSMLAANAGLPSGMLAWGHQPRLAVVRATVRQGAIDKRVRAEQVSLLAGRTGGVWFTVRVKAGRWYVERMVVLVRSLPRGGSASVHLEWYRALRDGRLPEPLGAVTQNVRKVGQTRARLAGLAPSGANRARVVLNVVGGGTAVMALPVLRRAVPVSPQH